MHGYCFSGYCRRWWAILEVGLGKIVDVETNMADMIADEIVDTVVGRIVADLDMIVGVGSGRIAAADFDRFVGEVGTGKFAGFVGTGGARRMCSWVHGLRRSDRLALLCRLFGTLGCSCLSRDRADLVLEGLLASAELMSSSMELHWL